jgi:hypothetical protein
VNIEDRVRSKIRLDLTDSQKEQIRERLDSSEDDSTPSSLMVRIAATHSGMKNKNKAVYIPEKMRDSVNSWIEPHEKPVLLHHEKHSDPIGRVRNAEYIDLPMTDDPSKPHGYISVLARVTDPIAITKILDERYLTVSIGGTTNEVNCSICDRNIAEKGICEHKKGKIYDGKECYWKIGKMTYTELSFVNTPADEHAQVESIETVDMIEDSVVFMSDVEEEEPEATEVEETKDETSGDEGTKSTDSEDEDMKDLERILQYEFTDEEVEYLASVEFSNALDLLVGDAKLSTAQRKKLSGGTFCGPNRSFPVPDCAHVTAARRLIGRAKGLSSDGKSRILACVSRKAKSLGCESKKKDESEDVELKISDVFALWSKDLEISSTLEESLDSAVSELEDLKGKVSAMSTTLEEVSTQNKDLKDKVKELENSLTKTTAEKDQLFNENADLIKDRHKALAEQLVDMRIALRKPDMREILSAKADERKSLREKKVEEFSKREVEALEYAINDLSVEVNDVRQPSEFIESDGKVLVGDDGKGKKPKKSRQEKVSSHLGIKTKGK